MSIDQTEELIEAADNGNVKDIERALKKSANINGDGYNVPLVVAADNEHYDAAKCLLTNGANVNQQNHHG